MARRPVAGGASMGRRCPVWGSEVWQRILPASACAPSAAVRTERRSKFPTARSGWRGPGSGTNTAAFVHSAQPSNTCDLPGGHDQTVIDNPFTNGEPRRHPHRHANPRGSVYVHTEPIPRSLRGHVWLPRPLGHRLAPGDSARAIQCPRDQAVNSSRGQPHLNGGLSCLPFGGIFPSPERSRQLKTRSRSCR